MTSRMPAIFFGHGNPMNAITDNVYARDWAEMGCLMPRPKAILCVSAHWYILGLAVTAMEQPRTIHDFGGFPRELFEVQYTAPGSPELAGRVNELLDWKAVLDEGQWGLDHGTWSVLCHVFPEADIPVVQLSIDMRQPPQWHYDLAKKLTPLRDEDVLVIGSGNLVHNLPAYAWGRESVEPNDWAVSFEDSARRLIVSADHGPLINYASLGDDAVMSVPTPDHYLPLLYVLALADKNDAITFPVEGFEGGSISMLTVQVG